MNRTFLPPWQAGASLVLCTLLSALALPVLADDTGSAPPAKVNLQQKRTDLLCGLQKAVCYSGFRKGQHPDRGDGAVNPTDAQVLEDLKILSRNGHFRLVRLYDSQVITEAGWATVASEFGPRASQEKQKRYYHELFEWTAKMNLTTFFFEAFDESWKGDPNNPLGAEKHWGLFTEERVPKLVMRDQYPDLLP